MVHHDKSSHLEGEAHTILHSCGGHSYTYRKYMRDLAEIQLVAVGFSLISICSLVSPLYLL